MEIQLGIILVLLIICNMIYYTLFKKINYIDEYIFLMSTVVSLFEFGLICFVFWIPKHVMII